MFSLVVSWALIRKLQHPEAINSISRRTICTAMDEQQCPVRSRFTQSYRSHQIASCQLRHVLRCTKIHENNSHRGCWIDSGPRQSGITTKALRCMVARGTSSAYRAPRCAWPADHFSSVRSMTAQVRSQRNSSGPAFAQSSLPFMVRESQISRKK